MRWAEAEEACDVYAVSWLRWTSAHMLYRPRKKIKNKRGRDWKAYSKRYLLNESTFKRNEWRCHIQFSKHIRNTCLCSLKILGRIIFQVEIYRKKKSQSYWSIGWTIWKTWCWCEFKWQWNGVYLNVFPQENTKNKYTPNNRCERFHLLHEKKPQIIILQRGQLWRFLTEYRDT